MKKLTLSASVQKVRNSGKGAGKTPWLTCVTVELGGEQVALGTLAGDWKPDVALVEFKKTASNPRWKRMGAWASAVLAGLVPGVKPALAAAA